MVQITFSVFQLQILLRLCQVFRWKRFYANLEKLVLAEFWVNDFFRFSLKKTFVSTILSKQYKITIKRFVTLIIPKVFYLDTLGNINLPKFNKKSLLKVQNVFHHILSVLKLKLSSMIND